MKRENRGKEKMEDGLTPKVENKIRGFLISGWYTNPHSGEEIT